MIAGVLVLVYLGGLPLGAVLGREAFSDTETWCWASRRTRATVVAVGAVIWPILVPVVLAGGLATRLQTMREERAG